MLAAGGEAAEDSTQDRHENATAGHTVSSVRRPGAGSRRRKAGRPACVPATPRTCPGNLQACHQSALTAPDTGAGPPGPDRRPRSAVWDPCPHSEAGDLQAPRPPPHTATPRFPSRRGASASHEHKKATGLRLQTTLTLLPAQSQAGKEPSPAAGGSGNITVTKGQRHVHPRPQRWARAEHPGDEDGRVGTAPAHVSGSLGAHAHPADAHAAPHLRKQAPHRVCGSAGRAPFLAQAAAGTVQGPNKQASA